MSQNLPVPRKKTVARIVDDLDGFSLEEGVTLVLTVTADDTELRVRDFAAFLSVLDSAFGRTDASGFLSYAHRPSDQLKISRLTEGSARLEFAAAVLEHFELWQMLVTYAVVTCLPAIVSGRAARNWAEAYRSVEEGISKRHARRDSARLTRRERSVIRDVLRSDPLLQELSRDDSNRLARAVEHVLGRESEILNRASRFSRTHVRQVALSLLPEDPENE